MRDVGELQVALLTAASAAWNRSAPAVVPSDVKDGLLVAASLVTRAWRRGEITEDELAAADAALRAWMRFARRSAAA